MSSRKQVNIAYLIGSVVMAGAFGLMAESWWLFVSLLLVLLAFRCYLAIVQPQQRP